MSAARFVKHFKSHGFVTNAAWSPDGSKFAFGILVPPDYPTNIYDLETGEVLLTIRSKDMSGWIDWSPEGDRILIPGAFAVILDTSTGEILSNFKVIDANSFLEEDFCEDWSPDGRYICTGHESGEVKIWDSYTGEIRDQFKIHSSSVKRIHWSPDGSRLLSSSFAGEAAIWDPDSGSILLQLLPEDYRNFVPDSRWSRDGSRVYLLTAEGDVLSYGADTGELLSRISTSPVSDITDMSLPPSEERVLVGGHDGEIRVWDLQQGVLLLSYETGGYATAEYSPDGKYILIGTTGGSYGSLQVFPTWHSPQELIDYAKKHKVFRQLTPEERERFGLPHG
jgi:WD40 repeat protein